MKDQIITVVNMATLSWLGGHDICELCKQLSLVDSHSDLHLNKKKIKGFRVRIFVYPPIAPHPTPPLIQPPIFMKFHR